ncbi:hypothetical protein CC1G_03948 [Coprinopsis cinerea okayama7|uniref:RRM Nup35-type domain-containing protein n=1 Tax=Coprinopsis cinerea (strain Okayama-7 / 130 / ATCC MYA-4618 / FGSC 9003) TaxID=240176 RepID=A8N8A1_COPC7|nr:hypothetical protein CC1G_03948 [Coprinopsis cinerea okayama7\|eukprot:XP_001831057.2 hypothetical protein CC1G_03948 [Coprinopsis cinerea okayama7\
MHNSPFTVAGMSSSTTSHHTPNAWGSSSTNSTFGESLSQSTRSHYQSGYLMSTTQNNNSPPGNQRVDEVPVVQTKAKLNQALTRGNHSDFGMESMFQSTRQRQNLADEDAPPISSVNDIPNEVFVENTSSRFKPRNSTKLESSHFGKRATKVLASSSGLSSQQPLYIIVFGYPADKYSVTVEYFKSLGESTEADPNTEIANCFRIGYTDPADAMRAVRKNGEVLGGSWMIGAKWADPAQAEALVGQANLRTSTASPTPSNNQYNNSNAMQVDEPMSGGYPSYHSDTPTVGTPIRLEPSTSAFKKPGVGGSKSVAGAHHHTNSLWGSPASASAANNGGGGVRGGSGTTAAGSQAQNTPTKSVLGQVSDLIFGW